MYNKFNYANKGSIVINKAITEHTTPFSTLKQPKAETTKAVKGECYL